MRQLRLLSVTILTICCLWGVKAQDVPSFTPSIIVRPQVITDDNVVIDEIVAERFGILAVYADDGAGNRGGLLGFSLLRPGMTRNLPVQLQMINVTPILHFVLHLDSEPFGEFQYGAVEGADMPVMVDGQEVAQSFRILTISVHDQFVDADNFNRIVVDTASLSLESDAWVVAHNDDNGDLGDVLGHTFLEEGTSQAIPLLLSGDITPLVHVTIHLDTGELEKFDYLDDPTLDTPYELATGIARTTIATSPTLRLNDQIVIGSDLTRNQNEQVPVLIDSVLSPDAGWIVIYADDGTGQLGDFIGVAPVQAGFNDEVNVLVTQAEVTPRLYAVLHRDTGQSQVFEYGDIDDVDMPFLQDEMLIMASALVIPTIDGIARNDNVVTVERVLIDTAGWLVAYAVDDDNQQTDILGVAPLRAGLNQAVTIDLADDAERIQLQLHYDTRPPGVFSFESNAGSDLPVVFDGDTITLIIE
ncbi:MAG: hypothetical protein AAF846_00585 [Chloroflexota bacterium]